MYTVFCMNISEDFFSFLKLQPQLFFIDRFLKTFPQADLFLVGGAVRDLLLHRDVKNADYDFVICNLSVPEIEAWFATQGSIERAGKNFEVFKFLPKGFHVSNTRFIDITLPRTESPLPNSLGGYRDFETQSDPSLPIENDLMRRDFTVNAMAFNFRTRELIDPYHGQADLKTKTLRAVGNPADRFQEDLTRILRGIRFAAELSFEIESHTWDAMIHNVPRLNRMRKEEGKNEFVVARETIGEELSKSLLANPQITIKLLLESRALEELFPSVWRHAKIDEHYLDPLLKLLPVPNGTHMEHAIILLLRELTEEEAKTTLSFTGLSTISKQSLRRVESDRVLWIIQKLAQTLTHGDVTTMRASQFEKQFMSEHGKLHLEILKHMGKDQILNAAHKRRDEICTRWKCEEHEPIPTLLSGEDIIRLGIPEGMRVRELIEEVRDKQLDGHLLSREAALDWVRKQIN